MRKLIDEQSSFTAQSNDNESDLGKQNESQDIGHRPADIELSQASGNGTESEWLSRELARMTLQQERAKLKMQTRKSSLDIPMSEWSGLEAATVKAQEKRVRKETRIPLMLDHEVPKHTNGHDVPGMLLQREEATYGFGESKISPSKSPNSHDPHSIVGEAQRLAMILDGDPTDLMDNQKENHQEVNDGVHVSLRSEILSKLTEHVTNLLSEHSLADHELEQLLRLTAALGTDIPLDAGSGGKEQRGGDLEWPSSEDEDGLLAGSLQTSPQAPQLLRSQSLTSPQLSSSITASPLAASGLSASPTERLLQCGTDFASARVSDDVNSPADMWWTCGDLDTPELIRQQPDFSVGDPHRNHPDSKKDKDLRAPRKPPQLSIQNQGGGSVHDQRRQQTQGNQNTWAIPSTDGGATFTQPSASKRGQCHPLRTKKNPPNRTHPMEGKVEDRLQLQGVLARARQEAQREKQRGEEKDVKMKRKVLPSQVIEQAVLRMYTDHAKKLARLQETRKMEQEKGKDLEMTVFTNNLSHVIMQNKHPFHDRMENFLTRRNTFIAMEREAKAKVGEPPNRPPTITKIAKKLKRDVDDLLGWEAKRKERLAQTTQSLKQEELHHSTFTPQLSARSRNITAKSKRAPISERTPSAAQADIDKGSPNFSHTPRINQRSKRMARQGSFSDRLYADAQHRTDRKQRQAVTDSASKGPSKKFTLNSPASARSPSASTSSAAIPPKTTPRRRSSETPTLRNHSGQTSTDKMQSPWFGFGMEDSDERDSEDEMTLPGARHRSLTYQDQDDTGALLDGTEDSFPNRNHCIDETQASSIGAANTHASHAELFQDSTVTPKQMSNSPIKARFQHTVLPAPHTR